MIQGFIKGLFQSKISINQIKEIERNLIQKLTDYDVNFEIVNQERISEISNIYFSFKPKGISIMREVTDKNTYNSKKSSREIFNINGIEFYNIKSKNFENVPCFFSNYQLKFLELENPEKFHKIFDTNNIRLHNLEIKKVKIRNPDKEIVEKILKIDNDKEIEKLDLENCFEIEFNNKKYYTILDFENANYIAVDNNGKVYFLNHDLEIGAKKIFENTTELLEIHNGNLIELENRFL